MHTTSEIAELIGVTDRTVRRLLALGLVRGARIQPRRWAVRRGEPEYLAEWWPLLLRLRHFLQTRPDVRLAVLHGSHALHPQRGADPLRLYLHMPGERRGERWRLKQQLDDVAGRPVALTLGSPQDVRREPAALIYGVLVTGRVIADRSSGWRRLRQHRPRLKRELGLELSAALAAPPA